jgi:hypothetical protein
MEAPGGEPQIASNQCNLSNLWFNSLPPEPLKLTSPFWSECEPPSESQVARLTEAGSGHSTLGTRARRQRTMTN